MEDEVITSTMNTSTVSPALSHTIKIAAPVQSTVVAAPAPSMYQSVLLRQVLGSELRNLRVKQARTLREVSKAAPVSLGYLSEVERGQKEASSELLAAICGALRIPLSELLRLASVEIAQREIQNVRAHNFA
jgi:hypothetical protein